MNKWMLTSKCNRSCEYCIVRNINEQEELDLLLCEQVLIGERTSDDIMITGGEPTLSERFADKVKIAQENFDNVYITTQNREVLNNEGAASMFDGITFSRHGEALPKVTVSTPVFLSILDFEFEYALLEDAVVKGFSGLTINEEQRSGEEFDETVVSECLRHLVIAYRGDEKMAQKIRKFSIKINRKGNCMNEVIFKPNMEVIHSFREYL